MQRPHTHLYADATMLMQHDDANVHRCDMQAKLRRELKYAGARDLTQYLTMEEANLVARTCFDSEDKSNSPSARLRPHEAEFIPSEDRRQRLQSEPRQVALVSQEQPPTHHVTRQDARLGGQVEQEEEAAHSLQALDPVLYGFA